MTIKKIFSAICMTLCVTVGISTYCIAQKAERDEYIDEYMDAVMEQLWRDHIPEALELIDNILNQHPDLEEALKLRYVFLSVQSQFDKALLDVSKLLELRPGNTELLLHQCVILEYKGEDKDLLLPCYADAVQKMRLAHSQDILKDDADYVQAVILAELPEAEEVRRNFLKDRDDLFSVSQRKIINEFDRNKLLEFSQNFKKSP